MKLEVLVGGLQNPNPAVRLDVVRVLGMTDEVRALEILRARYAQEPDPNVKHAIAWAGKRLYEAQQAGHSTLAEIFRHFGIDRELENEPDENEAELMRKLESQLNSDLTAMKQRAQIKQIGLSAAAGIGAGMLAGGAVGMGAAIGGMTAGAGAASSNMSSDRPQIGLTRTPPTAPTSTDISIWVKRLRTGKLPGQRNDAAMELAGLNNPAALPHLAAAFITDESPQVRQTAQRFGKILYWNTIYWDMEQSGELEAEMNRRRAAMGKVKANPDQPTLPGRPSTEPQTPPAASQEVDVGEILRKAKAARQDRKRR